MELHLETLDNGIKLIKLSGRLDLAGTQQINNNFAFNTTTTAAAIIIDMSEVEFLASIGMRMLLSGAKGCGNRGGKMVLYNPQPLVADALQTAGLDRFLPIFTDIEDAYVAVQP
jgi:anti-sigma B factor antagonist